MSQISICSFGIGVFTAYFCIVSNIKRHGTETGIRKKECGGKDTWHL